MSGRGFYQILNQSIGAIGDYHGYERQPVTQALRNGPSLARKYAGSPEAEEGLFIYQEPLFQDDITSFCAFLFAFHVLKCLTVKI